MNKTKTEMYGWRMKDRNVWVENERQKLINGGRRKCAI